MPETRATRTAMPCQPFQACLCHAVKNSKSELSADKSVIYSSYCRVVHHSPWYCFRLRPLSFLARSPPPRWSSTIFPFLSFFIATFRLSNNSLEIEVVVLCFVIGLLESTQIHCKLCILMYSFAYLFKTIFEILNFIQQKNIECGRV